MIMNRLERASSVITGDDKHPPGRSEFLEFSASNDDPLSQQSPARHPQPRPAVGAGSSAGQGGDDNRSPASAHADGTSKRKGRSGKGFVPKITPIAGAIAGEVNHGQHNTRHRKLLRCSGVPESQAFSETAQG